MDISKLLETVKAGVEFAEGLVPVLTFIPGAGTVIASAVTAVGAVTDVVSNIQERVTEGEIVLKSDDQAELRGYAERLSAVNDQLAAYIDQS